MRQSAAIITLPSIPFWLFKSASDDLMRAITAHLDGTVLRHVFKPWVPYERSERLMKKMHAVSDEHQAALDVRGYYLMRLRRFEAPITPETPQVPNQPAKPTTDPASGKELKLSPRRKATRQKKPRRVRWGSRTAGTIPAWRRRTTVDTLARLRNGFDRPPGACLASGHVPSGRAARQQCNSISSNKTPRRLARSAPRHWPDSRTTQHGGSDGPVAVALQIGFANMTGTAPLRSAGACGAGLHANKSADAFTGAGGSLCLIP